jgi:hypothetical protein
MSRKIGRPTKVICILCNKVVEKEDPKTIIALDRPIYLNIIVHRSCLKKTSKKTLKNVVIRHIRELL